MSCGCNESTPSAPACMCPPSPIPPWHRPVQSPVVQTMTEDGAVSLTTDVTYLKIGAGAGGKAITLPDGNYKRQIKRVMIPGDQIYDTATWTMTVTGAGFTSMVFDATGTSAVLEWDGAAWQMIGGNATPGA